MHPSELLTIPPPTSAAPIWRLLPRPARLGAGLVLVFLLNSHLLPEPWADFFFHGHGQAVLMFLVAASLSWVGLYAGAQRRSLWAMSLALWAWVAVDLVVFLPPGSRIRQAMAELGFFLYFLVLTLEFERLDRQQQRVGLFDALGAPLFLVGLFFYLVGLPLLLDSSEYDLGFPTQAFYLSMDIYLLLRCTSLLWYADDRRWRDCLALLRMGLFGVLLVDIMDGLLDIDWLHTQPLDFWQGMYYLPLLPLLGMAGFIDLSRWRLRPAACPVQGRWLQASQPRLLFFGFLPVALHLLGYYQGWLVPELRHSRELFLMVWVALVFFLLRRQQNSERALAQARLANAAAAVARFDEHRLAFGFPLPPSAADETCDADADPASTETVPAVDAEPTPFVLRLNQLLALRYSDPELDLEAISDALALSARQLQRRLKTDTGLSPADYLRRYRLERATDLLKQGHKAAFVAAAVGFSQQSHFGRLFKLQYGMTPGQYMQQHQPGAGNE